MSKAVLIITIFAFAYTIYSNYDNSSFDKKQLKSVGKYADLILKEFSSMNHNIKDNNKSKLILEEMLKNIILLNKNYITQNLIIKENRELINKLTKERNQYKNETNILNKKIDR